MDFRKYTTIEVPIIETRIGFYVKSDAVVDDNNDIKGVVWMKGVDNVVHKFDAMESDYKLFCVGFDTGFCFGDTASKEHIEMLEDIVDHYISMDEKVHVVVPRTEQLNELYDNVW